MSDQLFGACVNCESSTWRTDFDGKFKCVQCVRVEAAAEWKAMLESRPHIPQPKPVRGEWIIKQDPAPWWHAYKKDAALIALCTAIFAAGLFIGHLNKELAKPVHCMRVYQA